MKRILSLSLSLLVVAGLAACGPAGQSTLPPGQQTAPGTLSAAEINAKVDLFDAMLLVKGADGVVNPVTPERIESLSIDGKAIAANTIVLPGTSDTASYSAEPGANDNASDRAEKARLELASKSANGQTQAFFVGNGVYSFLLPKTGKNSTLALKLKGDSQSYQLVRVSNLSRGTFLLSGGQITGGFNTRGEFQVKQNGSNPLADLQAMFLGSYFALSQFDINGFANYYQANQGQVTITTQNNQRLVFEASNPEQPSSQGSASEADLNAAREQLQSEIGANINDLLGYIGSWTLESDLVKALVPGGEFSLDVSKTGTDTYRLTANLASGAYSGEGRHVAGSASGSDLKLGVSAGTKSLEVQFRLVSSNRAGAKLTKAEGVPELSALVGTEIFLRRAL